VLKASNVKLKFNEDRIETKKHERIAKCTVSEK
jgi:hypothetical protein